MTGLNQRGEDGETTLVLVCDRCGHALRAEGMTLAKFALLWRIAEQGGWRGPDRAIGPHSCRDCVRFGQAQAISDTTD